MLQTWGEDFELCPRLLQSSLELLVVKGWFDDLVPLGEFLRLFFMEVLVVGKLFAWNTPIPEIILLTRL